MKYDDESIIAIIIERNINLFKKLLISLTVYICKES